MNAQQQIITWLARGTVQRAELERLFVEFGGYGGATLRDDGEIHIYGSTQCACADEMASDHELSQFVTFIHEKRRNNGMDVFDAIEQRRAIKKFDPNHPLSDAQVMELFRLTLHAPTAFNMQNWRFLWLRDPALRQEMAKAFHGKSQATDAPLLVLILADLAAWNKSPERYWVTASEEVSNRIVRNMDQFYRNHEQRQRDEAMRSGGLAAQTLMLAAKGMGLDSCPMIGFDFEAAARLIRLPVDHCIVMAVAVGKRVEDAAPRGGQLPLETVVITDRFDE